ncbi:MAG: ribosome maturation factor RimM [Rikenellaceae bacterium]|nr:ribosome maturation factor RimM [Rikenellaceae bacterium]
MAKSRSNAPQPLTVGRVSKTFGLNGELVINLYDTFPYEQAQGESIYVEIDGIWTPFFFGSFRRRGQSKAVVVFDDMDTEYRASELTRKEFVVFAHPEEPEQDDQLYLEDLVGYTVRIDKQEGEGEITGFIESEFNPLFEVIWNGAEILIPAADDFIVEIGEKRKILRLELPEGLLEL